jgi:hypothetical protein
VNHEIDRCFKNRIEHQIEKISGSRFNYTKL